VKFVPFIVEEEQVDIRKLMADELLERSVQTAGLLNFRTGEESWVVVFGGEVNGESSDWHTSRLLHKDWLMVTTSLKRKSLTKGSRT
jgi:hypothetical protein